MQFGFLLLGEHDPAQLLRLACLAEQHGVQSLWYADEKFFRDPYVSLAYISRYTRRLQLGVCVTDPYTRHPALTAMAMGTLDEVTDRRAVLGLGAGFSGLQAMGLVPSKPTKALREAVELIRQLWAGREVRFEGETIAFHGGQLNFKSRAGIPILIASSGRQILRLAGEIADQIMLGDMASASMIRRALAEVKIGAARAGRARQLEGIPIIARVNLVLGDDIQAARQMMKPWIAVGLWDKYPRWDYYLNYSPEWEERLQPLKAFVEAHGGKPRNVGDDELVSSYGDLITDEMIRDTALVGTADDVVDQIVEIAATGIHQIAIYPMPQAGQTVESLLTRFVTEILPRAKARLCAPLNEGRDAIAEYVAERSSNQRA